MALATGAMVVGMFPVFSLGVLAPFIAEDTGLDAAGLGGLSLGLFGSAAIGSAKLGGLVDRVGPRSGLAALFLSASVAWYLGSAATTLPSVALAVAVAGIPMALAVPTTTRLFFTVLDARRRPLAIGIAHSGTQLGAVIAGAVLPTLASATGWRDTVRLAAALPLVGAALPLAVVPRGGGAGRRARQQGTTLLRALREVPGLATLVAFALIVNAVVNAGVMYLPTYTTAAFGVGYVTAGLATTAMGVASMTGKVLWGVSSAGRGRQRLAALVVSSVGVLVLIVVAPLLGRWALWLGAALFGLTATTWAVPTTQVAGASSGVQRSGTASAAVMMAGFAGGAVGPLSFGWFVSGPGFATAWLVAAVVLASSGFLLRGLDE